MNSINQQIITCCLQKISVTKKAHGFDYFYAIKKKNTFTTYYFERTPFVIFESLGKNKDKKNKLEKTKETLLKYMDLKNN